MTRRKLVRAVLAVATLAVVWLVVSPARAMAPVCDPRGAVGFAPPPQIQDEELSLDIPADCLDASPLESNDVVPGRAPSGELAASQEPVETAAPALALFVFAERLGVRSEPEARPPAGVRQAIDRPPRA